MTQKKILTQLDDCSLNFNLPMLVTFLHLMMKNIFI